MLFGWQVEQGVTSNSVIYVKDGVTVGIGTGEQDRVGVAEIGIFKAYTKYADGVCFRKHGISYKELGLAIERGERERALLEEIDGETREAKGGLGIDLEGQADIVEIGDLEGSDDFDGAGCASRWAM